MDALVASGVEGKRLRAKGYGESKPVIRDTTEEARAANRRVEFNVKKLSKAAVPGKGTKKSQ